MKNICERKTLKWIVILSCALFFCLNIILGDFSGRSDGFTRMGFPFIFYQDTEGKCDDCENLKWFKIIYFFIDLIFCLLLASIMVIISKRITKNNKKVNK